MIGEERRYREDKPGGRVMRNRIQGARMARALLFGILLACIGCTPSHSSGESGLYDQSWLETGLSTWEVAPPAQTPHPVLTLLPATPQPGVTRAEPTPDAIRQPPTLRTTTEVYYVQLGDTINDLAFEYGVAPSQIVAASGLRNPSYLYVGQRLIIPPPEPQPPGPTFKIVPDSELVYGPATALFDVRTVMEDWGQALARYTQPVEGRSLDGLAIVEMVAERYSVNPRLLLALLEYQGGWLMHDRIPDGMRNYPLGFSSSGTEGLYAQLSWAADQLNRGYYLWRAGWSGPYIFVDGVVIIPGPGINAGTAGVQYLLSQLYPSVEWRHAVGEQGFYQTLVETFGDPFERAVEPLVPPDLQQPVLQLPFEEGEVWAYTGGPHSAWGKYAAWGALDFAPTGYVMGCVQTEAWVVAAADGKILISEEGQVIQDLDGDGYEGTGWVLLYMHIESRDRVPAGAVLRAGDRIGHASCEGGISSGSHVHLARKYNGEWISADGSLPFNLDGWVSSGWGVAYDGYLSRGTVRLEACACRYPGNQISR